MPHGRSLGRPLEPRGPGLGIFLGALSGPRQPLSPGECPHCPLTPAGHLHPEISGPLPPWGSDTWGRGASNWPTWQQTRRPLHPVPTTAKIPLFFHPERGPPFRCKNGGRPPGDGFCPKHGSLVRGCDAGPGRRRVGPPNRGLPQGNVPLSCDIRPGSQGPWVLSVELTAFTAIQRTAHCPGDHTSGLSLTPAEAECPGKN